MQFTVVIVYSCKLHLIKASHESYNKEHGARGVRNAIEHRMAGGQIPCSMLKKSQLGTKLRNDLFNCFLSRDEN